MAEPGEKPEMQDVRLDIDAPAPSTSTSLADADGSTPSISTKVAAAVGQEVLKAGTARAQTFVSSYARIDLLRPYFDVEPSDVYKRFSKQSQHIGSDLYGPVMLALTLSAVLLMTMKSSDQKISREGTFIGTAFAVSFGYWLGSSFLVYAFAFIFNTAVTTVELLSTMGYGLFGYNVVLVLAWMQPGGGGAWFYYAWFTVGALSALTLALTLRSRTPDAKQGLLVAAVSFAVHFIYLGYLKWAYMGIFDAIQEVADAV